VHIPASRITSAISILRNVHNIMLLLSVSSAGQVSTVVGIASTSVLYSQLEGRQLIH
jgi:hypothetical protein